MTRTNIGWSPNVSNGFNRPMRRDIPAVSTTAAIRSSLSIKLYDNLFIPTFPCIGYLFRSHLNDFRQNTNRDFFRRFRVNI